jgi:hypothetical protein
MWIPTTPPPCEGGEGRPNATLTRGYLDAPLSIHHRTVENHRTNICRKLGLEGANALLRFALQN